MASNTIHQAGTDLTMQEREARQRTLHKILFKAAFDWLRDEHGFDPVVIGNDDDGSDIMAVSNMTPEVNGDMAIVLANVMGTIIGGADPQFVQPLFEQAMTAARDAARDALELQAQPLGRSWQPN